MPGLSPDLFLDTPDYLLIPLTNIMVVNETGQQIRFGQADTDEEITLQPKHLSMYCWRTNKASQRLRMGLSTAAWSESFSLSQEGTRLLTISTDQDTCSALVLEVERKSASLVISKFSGPLNIS